MPTLTSQQANILYTMPLQTVERLEQVLRSTLALQESIRGDMDSLATKKSLEPLATGRPAGPMAKPDEGSPPRDVSDLEKVQRGIQEGEPTGWEAERRIYEAALRTGPEFRGDGSKLMNTFQRWAARTISVFRSGGRGDQHPDLQAADVTEDVLRLLARLNSRRTAT